MAISNGVEKFYITTTLPYVNADPHLGFALEIVQADVIARYQKLLGKEVFFNTGTDEHGLKIFRKAQGTGKEIQSYVDEYADKFKQLMPALGISSDIHFIRTTGAHHVAACQEFWKLCDKNGFIYKDKYKVKYCVGCELEKTERDLDEHGHCLIHPHLEIEVIEEENYFFKFSKFQKPLLALYEKYPDFVVPDFRFNEIKQFVKAGLQDFSISRLKSKMPWGVPVPGDDQHVMYVWFDALINYISTLGWPDGVAPSPGLGRVGERSNFSQFDQFWGTANAPRAIQIAGKDNIRQQSAMWQAMLLAAGLPTSRQIIIHGFITSGGQKMSKSLGNVADPYQILSKLQECGLSKEQAIDALRYYLLREIPTFEDGDYTWERFKESYNANLANGLGNLVSRIMKMAVSSNSKLSQEDIKVFSEKFTGLLIREWREDFEKEMSQYRLQMAMHGIWIAIKKCDEEIQEQEPFKKIKNPVISYDAKKVIEELLLYLYQIALWLRPFLPSTSEKILGVLKDPKLENIPKLFPRIE